VTVHLELRRENLARLESESPIGVEGRQKNKSPTSGVGKKDPDHAGSGLNQKNKSKGKNREVFDGKNTWVYGYVDNIGKPAAGRCARVREGWEYIGRK